MRKPLALALAVAAFAAACDNLPTTSPVDAGEALPTAALSTPTPGVDHVIITPQPAGDTMVIGALTAQVTFTATAYDVSGNPIVGAEYAWTSATGAFTLSATTGESVDLTTTANGKRGLIVTAGTKRDTVWVRVRQRVETFAIDADSVYLQVGGTSTFTPSILDSLSQPIVNAAPAWNTADASVVTVDGSGTVTGVAASSGWVRIRASYGGMLAYGWVAVRNTPFVGSITVSPMSTDTFFAFNRTKTFSATVRDPDGNVINTPVTWSSSNPSVATVNATTGLVTSVGRGVTSIRATASQVTGSSIVRVVQYTGTISLTLANNNNPAIAPGGTTTITGAATDLDGYNVLNPLFEWTSTNPGVATVPFPNAGSVTVTGVTEGTVTITASRSPGAFQKTADQTVLVINAPSTPTGFSQTTGAAAAQGIYITWTDNSAIETEYRVERNFNGGAYAPHGVTAANATQWFDVKSGLINGATYGYRVKACTVNGCTPVTTAVLVVS